MAITATDKVKIKKYLREHALGDIYYLDMCDAIGKKEKISDVEFLDYFTDCVIEELIKDTKINIKNITKLVSVVTSFIGWVYESNKEVNEETLNKIRSFNELYENYINKNGIEPDEYLRDNYIKVCVERVNKLYPKEIDSELLAKYVEEIEALKRQIKDLTLELTQLDRENQNLKGDYDEKCSKLETIEETNSTLRSQLKEQKEYLLKIDSLNAEIGKLQTSLLESENTVQELSVYKVKFGEISTEITELKDKLQKIVDKQNEEQELKNKHKQIESLIYQKLLCDECSLEGILNYVTKSGIASSNEEISRILKGIKARIRIESNSFSLRPKYQIMPPEITQDKEFSINIPNSCTCYDILLVSDLHIDEINKKVLSGFDTQLNYCASNGINLIINAGDFFDDMGGRKVDYTSAVKNYKLIDESIESIPSAPGIYHAILGGNHDKHILKYGIDPIKELTTRRDDFIDLGYTHSTITLQNKQNILGKIDLHHPDTYTLPIHFDENGLDFSQVIQYLNNIYKNQNRTREDSYIDIFGHYHKNLFNSAHSYCFIESFMGTKRKKACHLKIYFDESHQIKYMLFMPLLGDEKLHVENEIVYQKILKK